MVSDLKKKNDKFLEKQLEPEIKLLKLFDYWLEETDSNYYNNSTARVITWGLDVRKKHVKGSSTFIISGEDKQRDHTGVVYLDKEDNSAKCSLSMNIKGFSCIHTRFIDSFSDPKKRTTNANYHFERGRELLDFHIGEYSGVDFYNPACGYLSFDINSNMLKFSLTENKNGKRVKKTVCFRGKESDNNQQLGYEYTTFIRDANAYRSDIQRSLLVAPSSTDKSSVDYIEREKDINGLKYPSFGSENVSLNEFVRNHENGLESFKHFLALYSKYAPDFIRTLPFQVLSKETLAKTGLQIFSPYNLINHIKPELKLIKFLGLSIKWDANRIEWVIFDKDNNVVGSISYGMLETDDLENDSFGYHMDLKYNNIRCVRDRDENQIENNRFDFDIISEDGVKRLTMLIDKEPLLVLSNDDKAVATLMIKNDEMSFSATDKNGNEFALDYLKGDTNRCDMITRQRIDDKRFLIEKTSITQETPDTISREKETLLRNLDTGVDYQASEPEVQKTSGTFVSCDDLKSECVTFICNFRDLLRENIPFGEAIIYNWLKPVGLRTRGFDLFVRHYDATNRKLRALEER